MRYLLPVFILFLTGTSIAQSADARLDSLISAIGRFEDSLRPRGENTIPTGEFPLRSATEYTACLSTYYQFNEQLSEIPSSELDHQHSITAMMVGLKLANEIDELEFQRYLVPMNAEGGFYNAFPYARNLRSFNEIQDYRDYVRYLTNYSDWLNSNLQLLREGVNAGIVAPRPVIQNALTLMDGWSPDAVEDSPYYAPFREARQDSPEMAELAAEAAAIIENEINPFYTSLDSFLRGEYMAASPEKPGVLFQESGKEFYESRIRYFTTLPLTADSVHQLGLSEVVRIRARMDAIIDSLNFAGTFEDFLEFLRTDPQFYAKTPQELLSRAAWLSKKAEAKLPSLFNNLYSLPFTVEPVPDHIAPTYTGGRYVPGSWPSERAGIYWVNTYKLDSRPFYTLPSLTLHEAVPGHHLQIMLAAELELPQFRRRYYISAFGEGWGLYSEFLGEEMEMYSTPYEMFGRLTYEMWRACRLVVDTGIHAYGWTREEAVDYMQSNTALSLHEVNTEIDRYIGWPGQAVSYKIGELKIKDLRDKAASALGPDFDIREFHSVILRNGSVPLSVLNDEVEAYIRETAKGEPVGHPVEGH